MKKKLHFSLLFLLLSALYLSAQSGLRPRGDVNCDWEVNIADINAVIDSIFGDAKYHRFYSYATDVNGDREINIADINMIIAAIQGEELPPMPTYSGTLPVLYINTEGYRNIDSKEKESYLHADWWLNANGIEGFQSIGSPNNPQGMLIKGRGNYTWTLDKKPFRIKLDNKEALMGMNKNRHFCLLAHADDHLAKLKNTVGFELSRRIGLTYTPAQEPVEVVLNGQYIGLYFLTEKPRVDKNRVNIEEQDNNETDPSIITGGWFIELNAFDGPMVYVQEHYMDPYDWNDMLCFKIDNIDMLSTQQSDYITQFLTNANIAIQSDDVTSTEWERYIDLTSLVKFYIVGEIMDNLEHFSSLFMYKHRGEDAKMMFGPVWDFGNSFTRAPIFGVDSLCYFLYEQPTFTHPHWIQEMSKFSNFQQLVREIWTQFYNSDFNGMYLDQFIDDFVESIMPANKADVVRWPDYDLDYQKQEFKHYIHQKINWLQSQWGD